MSQIYRSALRVLVSLEDSRQAESELKAFTHLPKQLSRASDEIANIQGRGSSERHLGGEEGQLLGVNQLLATIINVVRAVFDQRWFSRRWILQEVVVNPDVVLHCGQEEIAWTTFTLILQDFLALRLTDDRQTINSLPPFPSLIKMLELWRLHAMRAQEHSKKNDLLSLLEHFEHYDCADPRDRIYALAGIADNVDLQSSSPGKPAVRSDDKKLVVSMDEETSAAELYTALAGAIYSRSEHDEGLYYILSQAGSRRSRTPTAGLPELPSWVPDWSSPLHLKMLHFQSQPFFGFEGLRRQPLWRQPPTDTDRFSLTAMAKVITSSLSPLDAGEPAVDQPGELQCLTTLKVTWVGPPYPSEPAASSAQWLVASARQLWQRCKVRGEMEDPENADLRDRFIQTLAAALFAEHSQGFSGFFSWHLRSRDFDILRL